MNSDVKTNPNPSFAKFIGGIGVVILIVAAIGSMFNSGSTTGSSVLEGLKTYPRFWNYMGHEAKGQMMFCDRPGKYSCPLMGSDWVIDSYEGRHTLCVAVHDPAEMAQRAALRAQPREPQSPFRAERVYADVGPAVLYWYCFDADTGERAWYHTIYSTDSDADPGMPPKIECPDGEEETARCFGLDMDFLGGTEAYIRKHPEVRR